MRRKTKAEWVEISQIEVPHRYRRREDIVEDDKLRLSVERTGIQQPLVVTKASDGLYVLIDGFRRLEVARHLKHTHVPCVMDDVPEGVAPDDYRDRIRFILDEHRQDLLPSQRAVLIRNLMTMFRLNRKGVAEYLGVDGSTVYNWLEIGKLVPSILRAIDSEDISEHSARAFKGMTKAGQQQVWRNHRDDFTRIPAPKLHRVLREKYHPEKYPEFYSSPRLVAASLRRRNGKRVATKRPAITRRDQRILTKDLELLEIELRDSERDLERVKIEIALATKVVKAVLESKRLVSLIPNQIKSELQEFAGAYI